MDLDGRFGDAEPVGDQLVAGAGHQRAEGYRASRADRPRERTLGGGGLSRVEQQGGEVGREYRFADQDELERLDQGFRRHALHQEPVGSARHGVRRPVGGQLVEARTTIRDLGKPARNAARVSSASTG